MGEAPTATAAAAGAVWPHHAEGEAVVASPVLGGFPDPMHMYLCRSRYVDHYYCSFCTWQMRSIRGATCYRQIGRLVEGKIHRWKSASSVVLVSQLCTERRTDTPPSALARRVTPLLPLFPRYKPRKTIAALGSEWILQRRRSLPRRSQNGRPQNIKKNITTCC